MRRILTCLAAPILAFALAAPALAAPNLDPAKMLAGRYVLDKRHASLIVRVRHMGFSNYTMRFNVLDAAFDYDPKNPAASKVEVTVDVNSLDTGEPQYGAQFARQFLDVENHPTATFVSTSLTQVDATRGVMTGDLTLRGVTRPVKLDVVFDGFSATALGGDRAGFSAVGRIDRTEFGSTFLSPDIAADQVDLIIEVEFVRK
jgi:polyisoprenoid-binding protein YceI